MTISDDFLYLRKELDRLVGSLTYKTILGALDRIEAAYGRHQDAILDFGTAMSLTRDDQNELDARHKERGEAEADGDCEEIEVEIPGVDQKLVEEALEEAQALGGRRHSGSKEDARRILKKCIGALRRGAERRGDKETLSKLEGNVDDLVDQIMREKKA